MVAIVTGAGLGLGTASHELLGARGQIGSASLGRFAGQSYVNAATGNLVLESSEDSVTSRSGDLNVFRTYNSQGLLNDDNNDNWRFAFSAKVMGFIGVTNAVGSYAKLEDGHGLVKIFEYDPTTSNYRWKHGSGAHDVITLATGPVTANDVYYTLTDGQTQRVDYFTIGGRLLYSDDALGQRTTYEEWAGLIKKVIGADGSFVSFTYGNGYKVQSVTTSWANTSGGALTETRTRYWYDTQGRLDYVIYDETANNSSDNSNVGTNIRVGYTYDGLTSNRVASVVTTSDGTQIGRVEFTYIGTDYRVHTVKDYSNSTAFQQLTFAYDTTNRRTTVTDQQGRVSRFTYDAAHNRLTKIETGENAADLTAVTYGYDQHGNVLEIIEGTRRWYFAYDGNGNRDYEVSPDGRYTYRKFGTRNELVFEESGFVNELSSGLPKSAASALQTSKLEPANSGSWGESSEFGVTSSQTSSVKIKVDKLGNAFRVFTSDGRLAVSLRVVGQDWSPVEYLSNGYVDIFAFEVDDSGRAGVAWSTGSKIEARTYDQAANTWMAKQLIVDRTDANRIIESLMVSINSAGGMAFLWGESSVDVWSPNGLKASDTYARIRSNIGQLQEIQTLEASTSHNSDVQGVTIDEDGEVTAITRNKLSSVTQANSVFSVNRFVSSTWSQSSLDSVPWSSIEDTDFSVGLKSFVDFHGNVSAIWRGSSGVLVSRLAKGSSTWSTVQTLLSAPTLGYALASAEMDRLSGNLVYAVIDNVFSNTPKIIVGRRINSQILAPEVVRTFGSSIGFQPITSLQLAINSSGNIALVLVEINQNSEYVGSVSVRNWTNSWVKKELTSQGESYRPWPARFQNRDYHDVAIDSSGNVLASWLKVTDSANYLKRFGYIEFFPEQYYEVKTNDSLESITQLLYEVTDENISDAQLFLEKSLNNPALNPGDRLYWQAGGDWRPGRLPTTLEISEQVQRTKYVYDINNRLRFEISKQGRVTQYEYGGVEPTSRNITRTDFTSSLFPYDWNIATLGALATWASSRTAIELAAAQKSVTYLNYNGDVIREEKGTGTEKTTTHFVYDRRGNLLSKALQLVDGQAPVGVEAYTYDSLGRRLTSSGLGVTSNYSYTDDQNKVAVSTGGSISAGFSSITSSLYNFRGELISQVQKETATAQEATTRHWYDSKGRLRRTQNALSQVEHFLYDARGRIGAQIDANGTLTKFVYTSRDELQSKTVYKNALSLTQLNSLVEANTTNAVESANGVALTSANANIAVAADVDDRTEWFFYTDDGLLERTVDAEGAVTQNEYDGVGRLIKITAFVSRINLNTFATNPSASAANPASTVGDRVTRNYWDRDGLLVGTLNAVGGYTKLSYDAAGRKTESRALFAAVLPGKRNATTIAGLALQETDKDALQRWFYDQRGNVVATIDAEGLITQSEYNSAGLLKKTTAGRQVALNLRSTSGKTFSELLSSAPSISNERVTNFAYDNEARLLSSTQTLVSGTAQTGLAYNLQGQVIRTETNDAGKNRYALSKYDGVGRLVATLDGKAFADWIALYGAASKMPDDNFWAARASRYTYDVGDRLTRVSEPSGGSGTPGHFTLYFYNADNQKTYEIKSNGETIKYTYNSFNEVERTTQFTNRLTLPLNQTNGGDEGLVVGLVASLASVTKDSFNALYYTRRGEVKQTQNAQGADGTISYDAFGLQTSNETRVDDSFLLKTVFQYDKIGRLTESVVDYGKSWEGSVNLSTSVQYHDPFGRKVTTTDARGIQRVTEVDRNGRVVFLSNFANTSERLSYDGFGNVLTRETPTGTSTYSYDQFNRKVTMVSAEGIQTISRYNALDQLTSVAIYAQGVNPDTGAAVSHVTYDYDQAGRQVIEIQMAPLAMNSSLSRTEYDAAGRIYDVVDPVGRRTRFTYDAAGRVLSRTVNPGAGTGFLNLESKIEYDGQGRTIRETDTTGNVIETSYRNLTKAVDNKTGLLTTVTRDPLGLKLSTEVFTDAGGRRSSVVEKSNGTEERRTDYELDRIGRVTTSIVDPTGLKLRTEFLYDKSNNLIASRLKSEPTTDGLTYSGVTRYAYDNQNRRLFEINAVGSVVKYRYDSEGRVEQTTAYATTIDLSKLVLSFDGDTSDAQLDLSWLVESAVLKTDPKDQVTRTVYDKDSRVIYTIDSVNRATGLSYDAAGRVTEVVQFTYNGNVGDPIALAAAKNNASDITRRVTRSYYDAAGRLLFKLDPTNALTSFQYDLSSKVIRTIQYFNAFTGLATDANTVSTWATNASNLHAKDRATRNFYDSAGRLTFSFDGEGYLTQYYFVPSQRRYGIIRYEGQTGFNAKTGGQAEFNFAVTNAQTNFVRHIAESTTDLAGRVVKEEKRLATPALVQSSHTTFTTFNGQDLQTGQSVQKYTAAVGGTPAVTSPTQKISGSEYDKAGRLKVHYEGSNKALPGATVTVGVQTEYIYDGFGRLKSQSIGLGSDKSTTSYGYDRAGRKTSQTSLKSDTAVNQHVFNYLLDAFGNTTQTTDGLQSVTRFEFDKANRNTFTVDAENYLTKTSYTFGNKVESVTRYETKVDSNWLATPNRVAPSNIKDATTSFAYDKLDRVTVVLDAEQGQELFTYNALGDRDSKTNKLDGLFVYEYDKLGRMTQETLPVFAYSAASGKDISVINRFAYDSRGNQTSQIEAFGLLEQRTTSSTYDAQNRILTRRGDSLATFNVETNAVVNAAAEESYVYNARGEVIKATDVNGGVTFYFRNAAGQVTTKVDPVGAVTKFTYNTLGLVAKEVSYSAPVVASNLTAEPNPSTDEYTRTTIHAYDRNGNRTSSTIANVAYAKFEPAMQSPDVFPDTLVNGGIVATMVYDAMNRVVQTIDGNRNSSFTQYDKLGRKTLLVDARGYITKMVYSADGFVEREVRYANGVAAFGIDATLLDLQGKQSAINAIVAGNHADDRIIVREFDKLGRVKSETTQNVKTGSVDITGNLTQATGNVVKAWAYDKAGNIDFEINAQGALTDFTYDSAGRLTKEISGAQTGGIYLQDDSATATRKSEWQYNGLGQVSRQVITASTQQRIEEMIYSVGGRVDKMVLANGDTRWYKYDKAGNIAAEFTTKGASGSTGDVYGKLYKYDAKGRAYAERTFTTANLVNGVLAALTYGSTGESRFNTFGEVTDKRTADKGVWGDSGGVVRSFATYSKQDNWQEFTIYDNAGHILISNRKNGSVEAYWNDRNGNAVGQWFSTTNDLSEFTVEKLSKSGNSMTISRYDQTNNLIEVKQVDASQVQFTSGVEITTSALVQSGNFQSLAVNVLPGQQVVNGPTINQLANSAKLTAVGSLTAHITSEPPRAGESGEPEAELSVEVPSLKAFFPDASATLVAKVEYAGGRVTFEEFPLTSATSYFSLDPGFVYQGARGVEIFVRPNSNAALVQLFSKFNAAGRLGANVQLSTYSNKIVDDTSAINLTLQDSPTIIYWRRVGDQFWVRDFIGAPGGSLPRGGISIGTNPPRDVELEFLFVYLGASQQTIEGTALFRTSFPTYGTSQTVTAVPQTTSGVVTKSDFVTLIEAEGTTPRAVILGITGNDINGAVVRPNHINWASRSLGSGGVFQPVVAAGQFAPGGQYYLNIDSTTSVELVGELYDFSGLKLVNGDLRGVYRPDGNGVWTLTLTRTRDAANLIRVSGFDPSAKKVRFAFSSLSSASPPIIAWVDIANSAIELTPWNLLAEDGNRYNLTPGLTGNNSYRVSLVAYGDDVTVAGNDALTWDKATFVANFSWDSPATFTLEAAPKPRNLTLKPSGVSLSDVKYIEFRYRVKGANEQPFSVVRIDKRNSGNFYFDASSIATSNTYFEYYIDSFDYSNLQIGVRDSGNFLPNDLSADDASTNIQRVVRLTPQAAATFKVTTKQTYNAFGEINEERDALGNASALGYNTMGRLIRKTDPEVAFTNASGVNARARPETSFVYDKLGRVVAQTDAEGNQVKQLWFDGINLEAVRKEFAPDGGIKENRIDAFGDLRETSQRVVGDIYRVTNFTFDALSRVIRVDRPDRPYTTPTNFVGRGFERFQYDVLGRRIKSIDAFQTSIDSNAGVTTRFDADGRVKSVITANGAVTTYIYQYDSAITSIGNRLTGGWRREMVDAIADTTTTIIGKTSSIIDLLDYTGRVMQHTDLAGRQFTYTYNWMGQIETQKRTSLGAAPAQDVLYKYYSNGYLQQIEDRGAMTSSEFYYDVRGNRSGEKYTSYVANLSQPRELFQNSVVQYDELNRIAKVTDANQFEVNYKYDRVGNRRHVEAKYKDQVNPNEVKLAQSFWYTYDSMNRFTVSMGSLVNVGGVNEIQAVGESAVKVNYNYASERTHAEYYQKEGPTSPLVKHRDTYLYNNDGVLRSITNDKQNIYSNYVRVGEEVRGIDAGGRTSNVTRSNHLGLTMSTTDNLWNADNQLIAESKTFTAQNPGGARFEVTQYQRYKDGTLKDTEKRESLTQQGPPTWDPNTQESIPGVSTTTIQNTEISKYAYEWWDSAKQMHVKTTSVRSSDGNMQQGFSSLTYNANGHLTSATDVNGKRQFRYWSDADGKVLRRDEYLGVVGNLATGALFDQGKVNRHRSYYYFDDKLVGQAGNDGYERFDFAQELATPSKSAQVDPKDRWKRFVPTNSADFDSNYQPINSSYPAPTPETFKVRAGDSLYTIAQALWGDASMWYLLAEANAITNGTTLDANSLIVVPNRVANIHNNSQTFRPYEPGRAIGDVSPTLPNHPAIKQKSNWFKKLLAAIIAVIVFIVTKSELAATKTFAELTIATAAISAAVASVASQAFSIAVGIQDKFSWSQVALSALSAGVTQGVSGSEIVGKLSSDLIGQKIISAAVGSVVTQAVGVVTGLQDKFSWRGVAAAAVSAGLTQGIGGSTPVAAIAGRIAGDLAGAAITSKGRFKLGDVLINTFGSMVGAAIGEQFSKTISQVDAPVDNSQNQATLHPITGEPFEAFQQLASNSTGAITNAYTQVDALERVVITGSRPTYWQKALDFLAKGAEVLTEGARAFSDSVSSYLRNLSSGRPQVPIANNPTTAYAPVRNWEPVNNPRGFISGRAGISKAPMFVGIETMSENSREAAKGAVKSGINQVQFLVRAAAEQGASENLQSGLILETLGVRKPGATYKQYEQSVAAARAMTLPGGNGYSNKAQEYGGDTFDIATTLTGFAGLVSSVGRAGITSTIKLTNSIDDTVRTGANSEGKSWTAISSNARAVAREVENFSGLPIASNQRALLAQELRAKDYSYAVSKSEYASIQKEYGKQRTSLMAEWQQQTGLSWPVDANGVRAQAHHIIPQRYGGPNEWWNLQPIFSPAHQGGIHLQGSATTSVFPTRPLRLP